MLTLPIFPRLIGPHVFDKFKVTHATNDLHMLYGAYARMQ